MNPVNPVELAPLSPRLLETLVTLIVLCLAGLVFEWKELCPESKGEPSTLPSDRSRLIFDAIIRLLFIMGFGWERAAALRDSEIEWFRRVPGVGGGGRRGCDSILGVIALWVGGCLVDKGFERGGLPSLRCW